MHRTGKGNVDAAVDCQDLLKSKAENREQLQNSNLSSDSDISDIENFDFIEDQAFDEIFSKGIFKFGDNSHFTFSFATSTSLELSTTIANTINTCSMLGMTSASPNNAASARTTSSVGRLSFLAVSTPALSALSFGKTTTNAMGFGTTTRATPSTGLSFGAVSSTTALSSGFGVPSSQTTLVLDSIGFDSTTPSIGSSVSTSVNVASTAEFTSVIAPTTTTTSAPSSMFNFGNVAAAETTVTTLSFGTPQTIAMTAAATATISGAALGPTAQSTEFLVNTLAQTPSVAQTSSVLSIGGYQFADPIPVSSAVGFGQLQPTTSAVPAMITNSTSASTPGSTSIFGTGLASSVAAPLTTSSFSFASALNDFGDTTSNLTFGSTPTCGRLFGSKAPATQQNTGLFGGSSTSAFGSPGPTFGGFGGTPSGTGLFGQNANTGSGLFSSTVFATTTTNGTTVKFHPPTGTDTMREGGVFQNINTRHQCITGMKEYENKSLEELRLEDYTANRKGPQAGSTLGGFGQPTQTGLFGAPAASTSAFSFGTQAKPLFGTTTGTNTFGGIGTGLFGQNTQQQSTGLFGKPGGFVVSTTTSSSCSFSGTGGTSLFEQDNQPKTLFGQQPASTGLFGQPTTSQPSTAFGMGTSFSGFGATSQPSTGLFGAKATGFGTTNTTTTNTLNFGSSTPGGGGLFGAKPAAPVFATGSAFGGTTTPFASTRTTSSGGGLSFPAVSTPAPSALSFGTTTTNAMSFGTITTATPRTGFSFGAVSSTKALRSGFGVPSSQTTFALDSIGFDSTTPCTGLSVSISENVASTGEFTSVIAPATTTTTTSAPYSMFHFENVATAGTTVPTLSFCTPQTIAMAAADTTTISEVAFGQPAQSTEFLVNTLAQTPPVAQTSSVLIMGGYQFAPPIAVSSAVGFGQLQSTASPIPAMITNSTSASTPGSTCVFGTGLTSSIAAPLTTTSFSFASALNDFGDTTSNLTSTRTTSSGGGLSFPAVSTPAPSALSFGTTTTNAMSFGTITTATPRTGFSFGAVSSTKALRSGFGVPSSQTTFALDSIGFDSTTPCTGLSVSISENVASTGEFTSVIAPATATTTSAPHSMFHFENVAAAGTTVPTLSFYTPQTIAVTAAATTTISEVAFGQPAQSTEFLVNTLAQTPSVAQTSSVLSMGGYQFAAPIPVSSAVGFGQLQSTASPVPAMITNSTSASNPDSTSIFGTGLASSIAAPLTTTSFSFASDLNDFGDTTSNLTSARTISSGGGLSFPAVSTSASSALSFGTTTTNAMDFGTITTAIPSTGLSFGAVSCAKALSSGFGGPSSQSTFALDSIGFNSTTPPPGLAVSISENVASTEEFTSVIAPTTTTTSSPSSMFNFGNVAAAETTVTTLSFGTPQTIAMTTAATATISGAAFGPTAQSTEFLVNTLAQTPSVAQTSSVLSIGGYQFADPIPVSSAVGFGQLQPTTSFVPAMITNSTSASTPGSTSIFGTGLASSVAAPLTTSSFSFASALNDFGDTTSNLNKDCIMSFNFGTKQTAQQPQKGSTCFSFGAPSAATPGIQRRRVRRRAVKPPTFASTRTTSSGGGLSFPAVSTPAPSALSFGTTTTNAMGFGTITTATPSTGLSFGAVSSTRALSSGFGGPSSQTTFALDSIGFDSTTPPPGLAVSTSENVASTGEFTSVIAPATTTTSASYSMFHFENVASAGTTLSFCTPRTITMTTAATTTISEVAFGQPAQSTEFLVNTLAQTPAVAQTSSFLSIRGYQFAAPIPVSSALDFGQLQPTASPVPAMITNSTSASTPGSTSVFGTGLASSVAAPLTTTSFSFASALNDFGHTTSNLTVFATTTTNGTTVKFHPLTGTDTMREGGVFQNINTRHQCITCMKEYENKSLEELRLEDYTANRKGPQAGSTLGGFGQPTQTGLFGAPAASTSAFSFGTQAKPLFGTTTGTNTFGGIGTGLFGQNTQQQSTGLFGKPGGFGVSTTTSSSCSFSGTGGTSLFGQNNQPKTLFGQQPASTGLFGQPTTSQPSTAFGMGASFGGFGATSQPSTGLFGAKAAGFDTTNTTTTNTLNFGSSTPGGGGLFGAKPAAPVFGTGSAFGGTTTPFGSAKYIQSPQLSYSLVTSAVESITASKPIASTSIFACSDKNVVLDYGDHSSSTEGSNCKDETILDAVSLNNGKNPLRCSLTEVPPQGTSTDEEQLHQADVRIKKSHLNNICLSYDDDKKIFMHSLLKVMVPFDLYLLYCQLGYNSELMINQLKSQYLKEHRKYLETMSSDYFNATSREKVILQKRSDIMQQQQAVFERCIKHIAYKNSELIYTFKPLEIRYRYKNGLDEVEYECKLFQKSLIYAYKEEILTSIDKNQVTIISADACYLASEMIPLFIQQAYPNNVIISCEPNVTVTSLLAQKCQALKGCEVVGYLTESKVKKTTNKKIIFMPISMLFHKSDVCYYLSSCNMIIVHCEPNRNLETDILLRNLKSYFDNRSNFKVILLLAPSDEPSKFSNYFFPLTVNTLSLPNIVFPVQTVWRSNPLCLPKCLRLDTIIDTALAIHALNKPGDVLIFLDTCFSVKLLLKWLSAKLIEYNYFDVSCISLLEDLSYESNFDFEEPSNCRRLKRRFYVTTSLSEFFFLPSVVYVIDSGIYKNDSWDKKDFAYSDLISREEARLRKYYAGYYNSGICYRMYGKFRYLKEMCEQKMPEILSKNAYEVIIRLFDYDPSEAMEMDFVENLSENEKEKSLGMLKSIEAIKEGKLTKFGEQIIKLPFLPRYSKLIVLGMQRGYLFEAIVLVAFFLFEESTFASTSNSEELKKRVKKIKLRYTLSSSSDTLTYLNIFRNFFSADDRWSLPNERMLISFLRNIELKVNQLSSIVSSRLQGNIIKKIKLEHENDFLTLQDILFDCFKDNLCVYTGHCRGGYQLLGTNGKTVFPSSCSVLQTSSLPEFIVFDNVMKASKKLIMGITSLPYKIVMAAEENNRIAFRKPHALERKLELITIENIGVMVIKEALLGKDGRKVLKIEKQIKEETKCDLIIIVPSEEKGNIAVFAPADCSKVAEVMVRDRLKKKFENLLKEEETLTIQLKKELFSCAVQVAWKLGAVTTQIKSQILCSPEAATEDEVCWKNEIPFIKNSVCLTWMRRLCIGCGYIIFSIEDFAIARQLALTTIIINGKKAKIQLNEVFERQLIVFDLPSCTTTNDLKLAIETALQTRFFYNPHFFSVSLTYQNPFEIEDTELSILKEKIYCDCSELLCTNAFNVLIPKPKDTDIFMKAFITYDALNDVRCNVELFSHLKINNMAVEAEYSFFSTVICNRNVYQHLQEKIDLGLGQLSQCCVFVIAQDVNEQIQDFICMNLTASTRERLYELQKLIYRLLYGEVITCKNFKDLYKLFSHSGYLWLRTLEQQVDVHIIDDYRAKVLRVYGMQKNCQTVMQRIEKYLHNTENEVVKKIYFSNGAYPEIMLETIIETFGIELNDFIVRCKLQSAKINIQDMQLILCGNSQSIEKALCELKSMVSDSSLDVEKELLLSLEVCCACLTPSTQSSIRLEHCAHLYCKECLKNLILTTKIPVLCCAKDCEKELFLNDIYMGLDHEKEEIDNLLQLSMKDFISKNTDYLMYCPTPDCPMFLEKMISPTALFVICQLCSNAICIKCNVIYHYGYTCEAYQQTKKDPDYTVKIWMNDQKNLRKQCPKCNTGIEKNDGCNHMLCTSCKTDFCWLCLMSFTNRHEVYDHQPYCPQNQTP